MLVKFLSFIASVLGTARYKAILLSCLALLFSSAGIATMALWQSDQSSTAASKVAQAETHDDTKTGTSQLGESSKQAIESEQPQQNTSNTDPATTKPDSTATTEGDGATASEPEEGSLITLSQTKLTLTAGETSGAITATIPTQSNDLTWEVTADPATGLVVTQETIANGLRLTARADQQIDKKRTYDVIVTIKDAAQNVVDSQTITVTIL